MNKIKLYILAIATFSLSLFSCTDSFLDVDQETSIGDDNFYKTIDDFEMALVGCYDGYQRTGSDGTTAFPITSEVLSDNCFGGTGNTDGRAYQLLDRFDKGQSPSDNDVFNSTWATYYTGIFRCNILLKKLDEVSFEGEEETIARIAGETHFLRGLLYFELVRLFNKVPLLTEPTTDNVPQADPADVYKLIAEDLKFAAENINYPAWSASWASANDGRATQWAAKAMLGRVFLFYTGYYGKSDLEGVVDKAYVLKGLEDVYDEGGFSLVEDYKNLWEAACSTPIEESNTLENSWVGKGNQEAIFSQKFNYTSDYNGNSDGNRWLIMLGMRNTNWSPYGKGWGACTVNPKLFTAFESGDTRRSASIIDLASEGIESVFDFKDQREYTGYSNKKYTPMCYPDGTTTVEGLGEGDFQISQYQDYIVMRLSDVMLMAAELGSDRAETFLTEVRHRAGLDPVSVTPENIMAERRFEFAFEGIRYWDLLRQGIEVAASTIAETNVPVLSGNAEDYVSIDKEDIIATKGFMQIPNTQITLSDGVLVQNDGWK
nr:RagB/SusD family nutrient uptake outer membrane protein [uncultured Carboxylicivirga sp.]